MLVGTEHTITQALNINRVHLGNSKQPTFRKEIHHTEYIQRDEK